MRVSKVVKEYIVKKVNAVYNPKINDIDLEYRCKKEELLKKMQSFLNTAEEQMKAIIADNCETWNFEQLYGRNILNMSNYIADADAENEYRIKKDDLRRERDAKIEEIIVELELGGNRETLEKLLAEL